MKLEMHRSSGKCAPFCFTRPQAPTSSASRSRNVFQDRHSQNVVLLHNQLSPPSGVLHAASQQWLEPKKQLHDRQRLQNDDVDSRFKHCECRRCCKSSAFLCRGRGRWTVIDKGCCCETIASRLLYEVKYCTVFADASYVRNPRREVGPSQ
jgi:hypothetical protein